VRFFTGWPPSTVDVHRDYTPLLTTANDGAERTTVSTNGTYLYRVCQSVYCSNTVTVSF